MRVHLTAFCLLLATPASGSDVHPLHEDLLDQVWDGDEGVSQDFIEDRDGVGLDLNAATVQDLASLPGLSYADAERIVAFRITRGPFRRPRDLDRVGLPRPVVESLLPHVTVNQRSHPRETASRLRFVRRSSSARGRSLLTGSGLHARTTCRAGDLVAASITTDKDPVEGNPLDFVAGYAEVRSEVARLVVGDFRPGFAQGLVFSRWTRTPADLSQVVRRPSRQVGYRSTEENGALRGVYLEGTRGTWRVAALGSSARFDAATDTSGQVERLVEGGLHVTPLERSRADALRETALGLRIERAVAGRSLFGLTSLRSGFNPPFSAQGRGLSGASAIVLGLDASASLGHLKMAGEMAQTGGGRAWAAGATYQRPRVEVGLQARDYGQRFQTLRGAGFSTFGDAQNERGVFAGLAWRARRTRAASLTFDRAWRPGPTPTLPAGSARSSVTFRVRHAPLRGLLLQWSGQARWDRVHKGRQQGILPRRRRGLRVDAAQRLGGGVQLLVRGELVNTAIGPGRETGGSAFGELKVRYRGLRAAGRLTCFSAPSYESRIFEWEDAPEGMMAFRTLTGRGVKGYILISAKAGPVRPTLRLWRQRPLDGRKATTEVVAQVDVNVK